MAWIDRLRVHTWWKAAISDTQANVVSLRVSAGVSDRKLDRILRELRIMSEREDAGWARQAELIELVKQGSAAKDAKIAALEAALAEADATAQARVDAALAADSEFDADKLEAGNAALAELVGSQPEQPSEPDAPVEPEAPVEPAPEPEQPVEGDNGEQPSA